MLHTQTHTHAQTSGDQLQCLQLVPSSSAAVRSWRISWDVKAKQKLLITQESKFELISQFHFPFEVVREEPKQSPYEPGNNQNHSHFLGQKYRYKELFCSTSEFYYALRSEKRREIIKLCFLQDTDWIFISSYNDLLEEKLTPTLAIIIIPCLLANRSQSSRLLNMPHQWYLHEFLKNKDLGQVASPNVKSKYDFFKATLPLNSVYFW